MGTDITQVDERRAALARQHSDPPATVSARMPEIRLSVHMSKKPVPKGHFFIVDRNVEQDEDPIITDIGTEFECIVLRSCMKLSAYDSDANQSLAESTEFSDFQNEPIFIIDNAGDRPCIATVAPYNIIKQMKTELTKEEIKAGKSPHPLYPVLKDLKLQYIAYVLYKAPGAESPGIYLLKLGARGWLGMTPQGEACRYGEEADSSFIKVRSLAHKSFPRTTHMHLWRVFASSFKTGEKDENGKAIVDHYPSFGLNGEWGDDWLEPVEQGRELLKNYLSTQYARRLSFAWRNTSDRDFIPGNVAAMLDSATGNDEIAAILMGDRRLAGAAKAQLTIGSGQKSTSAAETPRTAAPRAPRKTVKQDVADTAKDLEGGSSATDEGVPPAATEQPSTFQKLFGSKGKKREQEVPQASIETAVKNAEAMQAKPQTTDPNAPGYYPPSWDEGDAGKPEPPPTGPVNSIPPGW